jgi:general secretion pathway protein I
MNFELNTYGHKKPITGIKQPTISIQNRVSRIEYPESSNQHRVSSIEHRVSSIERRATGFTLLEVMVAMAIMAIVLVSVYRMHSQTLAMNTANRFYTQAPMLAQGKLAQLATGSSEIIAGDSGDLGEKFPGYSWSVAVEEVSSEALGEVADDLKRIDLTVSYNEYVYSVRTFRLMREQ